MTDPDDDLDALLSPRPTPGPAAELREQLRERTGWQLVWLRRARRVRTLAACAAAAAAVLLGGRAVYDAGVRNGLARAPRVEPPVQPFFRAEQPEPVVVVVPVPVPPPDASRPAPPAEVVTAPQAELKAELADDPAEATRLYRLAGDKYLADLQDYRNAARCYRLFLTRAGDTGLSPDPADTWLLTSLKNTAFQEKYDAAHRND
jgi:hypothetical protein